MYLRSLINDPQIWMVFQYIERMKRKVSLSQIQFDLKVEDHIVKKAFQVFSEIGLDLKVVSELTSDNNEEVFIYPLENTPISNVSVSMGDWLALQAFYQGAKHPGITERVKKLSGNIESKLIDHENRGSLNLEDAVKELDRISSLDKEEGILKFEKIKTKKELNFPLSLIEGYISDNQSLTVTFKDKRSIDFYPHRIVVQNEELTLIGEDEIDNCLGFINLELVDSVSISGSEYKPNFTSVEINNFISGLREINENRLRLVLKIHDSDLELNPPLQYIEKPYVAINLEGQRIWGATLEKNEELFLWLKSIENRIEILDPEFIKRELKRFNVDLQKQIDTKKKAA